MTKNYSKFKNRVMIINFLVMSVWILFFVELFTLQIIEGVDRPQGIREEVAKGKRGKVSNNKFAIVLPLRGREENDNSEILQKCWPQENG